MKTLLILCFSLLMASAFSQPGNKILTFNEAEKEKYVQEYLNHLKAPADTIIPRSDFGQMPNSFFVPKQQPELKKLGNNGAGHDIYILPLDNMPMLKPDERFKSNMPVAGLSLNKKIPAVTDSSLMKFIKPYRYSIPKKS